MFDEVIVTKRGQKLFIPNVIVCFSENTGGTWTLASVSRSN